MKKIFFLFSIILLSVGANSQTYSVKSYQKISDTEGGFTAILDNDDRFGISTDSIGDLNDDGVVDIAVGVRSDDDGFSNAGCVYILFMNADGTVNSHQKISATTGGLTGPLGTTEEFGYSVAGLGDLDGDGVEDIAVGAVRDDDGAASAGAVYILFLNTDGTVSSEQKISNTFGGFSGTLALGDWFGSAIANIGDIDGDGNVDLAVGCQNDDDGGTDRGCVWIIFLDSDGSVADELKISDLSGGFAATLTNGDNMGTGVAGVGDLNADGVNDIVVAARSDDDGGANRGALYVMFLDSDGMVIGEQKISDLAGGFTGQLLDNDNLGDNLCNVGDWNLDGTNDIMVGSYDNDGGNDRGAAWVMYLDPTGNVVGHKKISDTKGNFVGALDNSDIFGTDMTPIGDLDGDGVNDYVVTAFYDDDGGNDRGSAYVLFMQCALTAEIEVTGLPCGGDQGSAQVSLSQGPDEYTYDWSSGTVNTISDSFNVESGLFIGSYWVTVADTNGCSDSAYFQITEPTNSNVFTEMKISETAGGFTASLADGDRFGEAVVGIGDLDGNNVGDVAVSAPSDPDGGAIYILFLAADGSVSSHQKISNTMGGFNGGGDNLNGRSLGNLGDIDGDGIVDLIVGNNNDNDGGAQRGAVWILFMNTDGTVKTQQKISQTQGGFTGTLNDNGDFGIGVCGIGDLDGDGVRDAFVGNYRNDDGGSNRGCGWVLFLDCGGMVKAHQKISSTTGGFSATIDDGDRIGRAVANLGDVNGDGITDLALGTHLDDDGGTDVGAVYVLFMNTDGTVSSHQKISATTGGMSGTLEDADYFATSVCGLGDLNGDGVPEMMVGANGDDDGGSGRGATYVFYLNSDGTVAQEQKISATAGGLTGPLDDDDRFGEDCAMIGDINNDKVMDFLIGARSDDDGGTDRGAAYIIMPTQSNVTSDFIASTLNPCEGDPVDFTNASVNATDYEWFSNGTSASTNTDETFTFLMAGMYDIALVADNGFCYDTMEVTIDATAPGDTSVTTTFPTLTSNATGVTYQWIECGTMSPIAGETNQDFTATQDGTYAVIITNGPCVDTSACHTILGIGLDENSLGLLLFPNPSRGKFSIQTSAEIISVEVSDELGRRVFKGYESEIDLDQSAGVYFVSIQTASGTIRKKLILQ